MKAPTRTGAAPKTCTVTRSKHRDTNCRRDAYAVSARDEELGSEPTDSDAAYAGQDGLALLRGIANLGRGGPQRDTINTCGVQNDKERDEDDERKNA